MLRIVLTMRWIFIFHLRMSMQRMTTSYIARDTLRECRNQNWYVQYWQTNVLSTRLTVMESLSNPDLSFSQTIEENHSIVDTWHINWIITLFVRVQSHSERRQLRSALDSLLHHGEESILNNDIAFISNVLNAFKLKDCGLRNFLVQQCKDEKCDLFNILRFTHYTVSLGVLYHSIVNVQLIFLKYRY